MLVKMMICLCGWNENHIVYNSNLKLCNMLANYKIFYIYVIYVYFIVYTSNMGTNTSEDTNQRLQFQHGK